MCTETAERKHTIGCKRLHTYINNVERERAGLGYERERESDRERNVYPHAHMQS